MSVGLEQVRVERPTFVVGPVTTQWESGAIVGLVGPNGSGKTTLLRGLLGLTARASGDVVLDGVRFAAASAGLRRHVGYMPDDPNELVAEMTPIEYWTFLASCRSGTRAQRQAWVGAAVETSEALDLEQVRSRIDGFSHGMRSKTQLVAALMFDTKLIVLDEPRNGMDPIALDVLEALLLARRAAGATVVVSSHDVEWVDRVADICHLVFRGDVSPFELRGGDPRGRFARAVDAS